MAKEKTFLGFNLFTHIAGEKHRNWNQANTYLNIIGVKDRATADRYLGELSDRDQTNVRQMFQDFAEKGYSKVHKEVLSTLQ